MQKGFFIGASAGVFFINIDEEIYDNFNQLADMIDVFIEKTRKESPFLVYGLIENKQKIAELKKNKELLKNLADVRKWVANHEGEFRLENLKEIKMNLLIFINEYAHFILGKLKTKTNYPNLRLGEVHYLDYNDISSIKDIEEALAEQVKAGETTDHLLSQLFIKYLKSPDFQEEVYEPPLEPIIDRDFLREEPKPKPTKIKLILEEIRKGIRRQCPKCLNNDRNKIREVIDRDNIIMKNPNVYGFKFICGNCSTEWRTQKNN